VDIEYTVSIWKEGNQLIAHAMPLNIMSSGKTTDEARKALDEAVHLFLATTEEMGTLDEVLEECGYEFVAGKWASPSWIAIERHTTAVGA
jgi:predicted RNase H-like HicB family nuclease